MRVSTFALPALTALTVFGVGACSTSTVTVTHTVTVSASGAASPATPAAPASTQAAQSSPASASSAVPVLSPGSSATFSIGSTAGGPASDMTWTMGSSVATAPDSFQGKGYQDVAFNLTIKNAGSAAIQGDPTNQTSMVWRGADGRTDDSLQGTAATNIEPGTQGLNGQDLELMTGIPAKGYGSGYVELLVPTSPGAVVLVDPNTSKTVLVINYDKLTTGQLSAIG